MRRYDDFASALSVLVLAGEQDLSNEFIQSGVIDKFSLQFELGWKMLKDLLRYEGVAEAATGSPRDVLKLAYRHFDFIDEGVWLSMLRDRNSVAHVYDGSKMRELLARVIDVYIPAFMALQSAVSEEYGNVLGAIG